jgi:hypothetical protein
MNSSPDKPKKAEPLGLSKKDNIAINSLMAGVGTVSAVVIVLSLTGNFSKVGAYMAETVFGAPEKLENPANSGNKPDYTPKLMP